MDNVSLNLEREIKMQGLTFHAYIAKKATVSADQTTAKDFQKNGIITLINGMRRNR